MDLGILPRALHHIFSSKPGLEAITRNRYCVHVQFVELHNDTFRDLLQGISDSADVSTLPVAGIHLCDRGMSRHHVTSAGAAYRLMVRASRARA